MQFRGAFAIAASVLAVACRGSGGSGSTPDSPSPMNTNLSGTWNGTLSRPSGLAPISVNWTATQDSTGQLTGPLKMTKGSVSVTATLSGFLEGGSENPLTFRFQIKLDPGSAPASPACSIGTGGNTTPMFTGFTQTSTTLTSNAFTLNYNSCAGFVDPDPQRNFHSEDTQLTLTKQ